MTGPIYSTHGPRAEWTVEQDFEGNYFAIGPNGQIVPGTVASAIFTKAVAAASNPIYLPNRLQREVDILGGLWGLSDMQREGHSDYYCLTKAGSTTSTIKIQEPVLPNGGALGQTLEILDMLEGVKRPPYSITSITGGDTLNLSGAMSEAAPTAGVLVRVIASKKPLPDTTDFPNPSVGFKIGANWFVLEVSTSKIWRATLSGSTLSKVASGAGDCDLVVGAQDGNANVTVNHLPQGAWDFSGATVTGLAGGSTPTGTGFRHVTAGVEDGATKLVENADVHASAAIAVSKLDNGSALSVLGRSANSTGSRADMAAGTDGHALRRSGTTLGFGTIQSGGIADGSVTNAKLANDTGPSIIGIPSNVLSAPTYIGSPGTNDVMREDGAGEIGWGKISVEALASAGNGDILYYDDANSRWALLGIGSEGDVLKVSGGLPAWVAP